MQTSILTLVKKLKVLTAVFLNNVNVWFSAFSDNSTCSLVTWWLQLFKFSVYLEFSPSHGWHLLALIPATIDKTTTKRRNAPLLSICPTNGTKPSCENVILVMMNMCKTQYTQQYKKQMSCSAI